MVQAKSEGRWWFKQMSSVAVVTDCNVQFWLSQRTLIPSGLLSGIVLPDLSGCTHNRVELQVPAINAAVGSPPPQAVSKNATNKQAAVLKRVLIQSSAGS
jgi:hypothetical protein